MHASVTQLRLHCREFWVDVRLFEANGRWIACADTVDGPSLGRATDGRTALLEALHPFDCVIDELIASLPAE